MSTVKFVPAVTETKPVEVAPAKVVLELTPEQAGKLRALLGKCLCGEGLHDVYEQLARLRDAGDIPSTSLVGRYAYPSFVFEAA